MISQIASAIEAADAEEQRILAGIEAVLARILEAKQVANEAARADLVAILNPHSRRPQTQQELDDEFRNNLRQAMHH